MSRKVESAKRTSALLDELMEETPELLARLDAPPLPDSTVPLLPISDIAPDPAQPRRYILVDALNTLSEDIQRVGVLQPVVVRPASDWNGYVLVFGERRYRAALKAGITHLPAIIRRDLSDIDVLDLQWQENAQREDVDDIDKALHLKRMKEARGLSWSEMATVVHLSKRHLLRMQQMADMPETILSLVRERKLTPSHLYALARVTPAEAQADIARKAAEEAWSVVRLNNAIQSTTATGTQKDLMQSQSIHPWTPWMNALRQRFADSTPLSSEERLLLEQVASLAQALLQYPNKTQTKSR